MDHSERTKNGNEHTSIDGTHFDIYEPENDASSELSWQNMTLRVKKVSRPRTPWDSWEDTTKVYPFFSFSCRNTTVS